MSKFDDLDLRIGMIGANFQKNFPARTSEFSERGATVFTIPTALNEVIKKYANPNNTLQFSASDCADGYVGSDLPDDVVRKINEQNIYYGEPSAEVTRAIETYVSSISSQISDQIGYNFRVINVRGWDAKPLSDYGPSGWHKDGSSQFLPKILLYPCIPNIQNGTLEFFDRTGGQYMLNSNEPLSILIDSAVLKHRGRPSATANRLMVEITLAPDFVCDPRTTYAGQNARFPEAYIKALEAPDARHGATISARRPVPTSRPLSDYVIASTVPCDTPGSYNNAGNVNIGGGPAFSHEGWINIDEFAGDGMSVALHENVVLPIPSGTVALVYSSHCLEHLPLQTIKRCLKEARRILRPNGTLFVKVPDFDRVLAEYKAGNASFFADHWNIDSVVPTWQSRGVADCLEHRVSMIFCGFWNKQNEHAFAPSVEAPRAAPTVMDRIKNKLGLGPASPYHGPAVLTQREVKRILSSTCSPSVISGELSRRVRAKESDYTFNHQTAFSKGEFISILEGCDFRLMSTSSDEACTLGANIPGLLEMREISAYFVAKPEWTP